MENEIIKTVDNLIANQKFAVGNDLVFIPGFKASFNALFKKKVYTIDEIAYCDQFDDSIIHYASTWAAKEAVYKAIKQVDQSTSGWKKIEIVRKKTGGRPHVILHKNPGIFKISLTISHDGDYAWAIALIDNSL
jgi:holo-[acyl-carrier protein] synthase